MFWDNFVKLCNERNTKPNPVAKELGLSSGSVTAWRNGVVPRDTALQKIAEYFGVTVSDLIEEKKPAQDGGQVEEFIRLYSSLSPELQEAFLVQLRLIAGEK
ncbi:MAG: helix-turn-helix transcriptional regulator [Clostridia bacterium]|nr:helix-turn-helix transcriptional regulator [Clostridia bacterium]